MKNPKYHLYLTGKEYSQIINFLVNLKNQLISEGRYTDAVDELLIKFSKARTKKLKVIYTGSFFMPLFR